MEVSDRARRAAAAPASSIDVLAFPPGQAQLLRWQAHDARRWRDVDRRARVALFFGAGMFLAWAADVGAAFEAGAGGSTLFGVASIPLALAVVGAHLFAQWSSERARRGLTEVDRRYADVTLREAAPLLKLARENAVVAQYLRCVGRQPRALRKLERVALYQWIESEHIDNENGSRKKIGRNLKSRPAR